MKDTFFVTTPIYYSNGIPHVGHAYSSIIADTIARYNKISGKKTKFSTGIDENSQKVVDKAAEEKMDTEEYMNMMAWKHKDMWDGFWIEYTDFVRTSSQKHHDFVKTVLQKSFEAWDIYEGEYEWMYCVGCEAFKKDEDLVYRNKTTWDTFPVTDKVKPSENIEKVCPDHLTKPDTIKEKNYFFKLSKYQKVLEEFYENNPDFVVPSDRFNEVKAFVSRWLEDFSISRETNKFGITLPFDESQVTYVWYDALFNYLTVCQWGDEKFWPADLHVVGKDIIRFHAIYWPAMLLSAWYDLPKQILTTWFFTIDWQKISKSLGNVIDPVEFSNEYSKDLLSLYLLSSFNIGQDWDFDKKQAILTYNAKLANNLGNLVNRVVVLSLKLEESPGLLDISELPDEISAKLEYLNYSLNFELSDEEVTSLWESLKEAWENLKVPSKWKMLSYNLKWAIDDCFMMLDSLNKFADEKQPWVTIKEDEEETRKTLYTLAEWLRQVWFSLYPFFPQKMWEMFTKLGLENYVEQLENWKLEELRNKKETFKIKEKWEPLYKRFDV